MGSEMCIRDRKWTNEMIQFIKRKVLDSPFVNLKELQQLLHQFFGEKLSISGISRQLKKNGLRRRIAATKPLLSEIHKKTRLKFAMDHYELTFGFWKSILFTDETSIEVGVIKGKIKVWRRRGARFAEKNIVRSNKSGRKSIMFWGNFFFH